MRPCDHAAEPADAHADDCRVCQLYLTDARYNAAWGGDGRVVARRPDLPCVHLGPATGERSPCPSCPRPVQLKVFACEVHGTCTPATPLPGAACCRTCADYAPDTFRLVAPLGTADQGARWTGRGPRRPWEYTITCVVPHLDTPDHLEACLELLRLQTERPYLVVVDTGSPPAVCRRLEGMRRDDCEVHFVAGHGYVHSSGPVAAAMDLGFALCRTPYLFSTHTDVFARRRDLLAWLLLQCDEKHPVVGWEQSPRANTDGWRGTVSHTATLWDMRVMRRIGLTWSFERYYEAVGLPARPTIGYPDTEQPPDLCLRRAGVTPKLLGPEVNYARQVTEWWDHARSYPGLRAYGATGELRDRAEEYAALALAEARARAREWAGA